MSALGQKQTFALHQPMSALPPKADIRESDLRKKAARGRSLKGQTLLHYSPVDPTIVSRAGAMARPRDFAVFSLM
jgi:hypothetical protein